MALDDRSDPFLPVGVTAPKEPLGLWPAYRAARRNVLELIPEAAYREPVLTGGRPGRPGWIMVMEPDALERIFKTRESAYPKSAVTKRLMRPRQGDNLITAEGETWRWQRRAMAPIFQPKALAASWPAIIGAADRAVDRLEAAAQAADGAPVDVHAAMVEASCDVIMDIALSGREALDREALRTSIESFLASSGRVSLLDMLGAPNWIPRPGELFGSARARMDRIADETIAARRARGPSEPPDFLDALIAARDPDSGRAMSPADIRNNLVGFLFAGHETTALALSWALYLLSRAPAAQEEAAAAATGAGGNAEIEDLAALGYLRQVLDEAMRLYPPAGFLTRAALEEDALAGRTVRPGATVILPIYALHRHEALWDAPFSFAPERFAPAEARARHRYAYLPFGAGPRVCIGSALALIEAQAILARLLSRFTLTPGPDPIPRMSFTLRPADGVRLRLTPRAA